MRYITTVSGKHFDPVAPDKQLIDIYDIAHALSNICRANGHFSQFYSVAQHSIACAKEAQARGCSNAVILGSLLHDGSEAYLSDVTRPIKAELPHYLEIEERLQNMIWVHFIGRELNEEERNLISEIDDEMLSMEFHQLMPEDINTDYQKLIRPVECTFLPPDQIRSEFIDLASGGMPDPLVDARLSEGSAYCKQFLESKRGFFSEVKPSDIPEAPGVYSIFNKDTGEALYVGRTKNLRQRLYHNHLHGPISNARLKKYLIHDPSAPEIQDLSTAKLFLKEHCFFQYMIVPDLMERGRLEGLLSYLLQVRYLYEEH